MLFRHCYLHSTSLLCCLFIILCCYLSTPSYATCLQSDRHSLLAAFSSSLAVLNWSSTDCCQWTGIECDRNGRVARIILPSKGLSGGLSPPITNLTHLSHLDLSFNGLTGSLPDGLFSSLSSIEIVDLSHNMLQGELPPSFSLANSTSSIQSLDLSNNRFHGSVSPSLFHKAINLILFNVSRNILTGKIPNSICGELRSLKLLDFSFNGLSGEIPRGFGECSKLEALCMSHNSFSGMIPNEIYTISTLREVDLASNRLRGPINIGITNLTKLTILDLHYNDLSGGLPVEMGKIFKLEKLVLDQNYLNGTITTLMNYTHLRELKLSHNFFEGDLSNLNFSKVFNLRILDLSHNIFVGEIPLSIYTCKSLRAVRLSKNKLEGQITTQILGLKSLSLLSLVDTGLQNITRSMRILMACKKLKILFLTYNFLDEVMPHDIDMQPLVGLSGFQNLRLLSLAGCHLHGQLPDWLKMLKNLHVLDMQGNRLTGPIPSWLGSMPNLFFIHLAHNRLTGPIPPTLWGLRALTSKHFMPDNATLEFPIFTSSIHPKDKNPRAQVNQLSSLPRGILLNNNSLLGDIPREIGCLTNLQLLDLSYNNLSGSIPTEISMLSGLESLNLRGNHLSGKIPESFSDLNFLRDFDVSFNDLQGQIPKGTQLQSFDASAYEGNPKLCGQPLLNQCKANDKSMDIQGGGDRNGDEMDWFNYLSISLGFATGFSAVCSTLLLSDSCRNAYFQFLTNVRDRIWVTALVSMARVGRRF